MFIPSAHPSPLFPVHGLACFHVLFQLFQLSMDLLAYTGKAGTAGEATYTNV